MDVRYRYLSTRPSKQGFDIVIGNPPYVSSKELKKEDKELYSKYYTSANNQMDLYSLFIELATVLLKPNAISSYIVPDSLIGRSNFSTTRYEIICKRTILRWLHLNNVFKSANVASIIYVFKNELLKDYTFDYVKAENVQQWKEGKVDSVMIQKSVIEHIDGYKVNFSTEEENNLLFKVNAQKRHDDILKMWRGEEMGRKSSLISLARSSKHKPLLAGDNVHRYEGISYSRYIDSENVGKSNYDRPKIIIRQLGTCINATLDLEGCITLQSIYNIVVENDEVTFLKFLLGLLNSKLYDFIYNKTSGDKQMFQRIILENIKQLPYPDVTEEKQQPIVELVDTILAKKKQNPQADTSVEENAINQLVYQLYGLSKEEISLIEKG